MIWRKSEKWRWRRWSWPKTWQSKWRHRPAEAEWWRTRQMSWRQHIRRSRHEWGLVLKERSDKISYYIISSIVGSPCKCILTGIIICITCGCRSPLLGRSAGLGRSSRWFRGEFSGRSCSGRSCSGRSDSLLGRRRSSTRTLSWRSITLARSRLSRRCRSTLSTRSLLWSRSVRLCLRFSRSRSASRRGSA